MSDAVDAPTTESTATGSAPDDKVVSTIVEALARVLKRDTAGIEPQTRLFDGLGLDSTTVLELLMELEGALGVDFDADSLEQDHFETVETLAGYVREHLAG